MGPYRIICYINNEKFKECVFDRLIIKENNYYSPSARTLDRAYYDKFTYILGDFLIQERQYDIEITVEDFTGNSTRIKRQLIIR